MAMTEKQGGSDVRANTTRAEPIGSGEYVLDGSGNVIALDVLRAIQKEPEALERVLAEIHLAKDRHIENFLAGIDRAFVEHDARRLAETLALALQASLLLRFSPPAIADAFCVSRLVGNSGHTFGTLPRNIDVQGILASIE
jgi:putative acyl-CoA dehydrogenase